MKRCPACGEVKAWAEFHRNRARSDGHQNYCRPCRAVLDHERYERRVGRPAPRYPHRGPSQRGWLLSLKQGRACTDCGRIYPSQVMQWDHLPGTIKLGNISTDFRKRTTDEILTEIAKCELVCANCHAIRTYTRSGLIPLTVPLRETSHRYAAPSHHLA
ncbi:MAG: hypothetical protein M3Q61_06010 [Chloroflexota bacterium]|nr:hypothetical protein [Chloroflexota bacterium]